MIRTIGLDCACQLFTFDKVSLEVLDLNSDAVAAFTLTYAMSTDLLNGTKGKGNFKYKPSQNENIPAE